MFPYGILPLEIVNMYESIRNFREDKDYTQTDMAFLEWCSYCGDMPFFLGRVSALLSVLGTPLLISSGMRSCRIPASVFRKSFLLSSQFPSALFTDIAGGADAGVFLLTGRLWLDLRRCWENSCTRSNISTDGDFIRLFGHTCKAHICQTICP